MTVNDKEFRELDKAVAAMRSDLENLKDDCKQFATKAELFPIRIVVFGAVGMIITAFFATLIAGHIK